MMEEQYLRDELNQRIMYLYKHSISVMTTMMTMWTAIAGFAVVLSEKVTDSGILFSIIVPLCLFFSLTFACLSSMKFRENNLQITKIAAYIACFYNRPIGCPGGANMWELSNLDIDGSTFSCDHKDIRSKMNGEYIAVAAFATVMEIAVMIYQYINCIRTTQTNATAYLVIYILFGIISVYLNYVVWKNTNLIRYKEEHIQCLKTWYIYGKRSGFHFETLHEKLIERLTRVNKADL